MLAIAAMLLLAALAVVAAPAYAQDAGGGTPPPPGDPATTPPSPPTSDPAPTPAPAPDPAPQPPADNQPPPDQSPPSGGGGSTPSTGGGGDSGTTKQPARPSGDEFTTSTAPSTSSTPAPTSSTSNPSKDLTGSRASDTWLGQDTFTVSKTATKHTDGATTVRRRFAGLFLLGASTQASRTEAKARRAHETAKVSEIGGGPPKPGNPLPSQNPFFNLLSGPGGIAASLMLASMLAVLGAAFVLPRDRLRAFRTPTVTWRPLAYVPPIELPG